MWDVEHLLKEEEEEEEEELTDCLSRLDLTACAFCPFFYLFIGGNMDDILYCSILYVSNINSLPNRKDT